MHSGWDDHHGFEAEVIGPPRGQIVADQPIVTTDTRVAIVPETRIAETFEADDAPPLEVSSLADGEVFQPPLEVSSLADGEVFQPLALFLPQDMYDEEVGDALEVLDRLVAKGAPGWQLRAKVVSTYFWCCINAIRYIIGKSRRKVK